MAVDARLAAASLAVLRSLRGKLAAIAERNPGSFVEQVALIIDAQPPVGYSGGLGGDDQYLTPENLSFANGALLLGAELPIILTLSSPSEFRSPTQVGLSREHVGQLLARVSRALGRLSGTAVIGRDAAAKPKEGSDASNWSTGFLLGAVLGPIAVGWIASLFKPAPKTSKDYFATAKKNWEQHHPGDKYPY